MSETISLLDAGDPAPVLIRNAMGRSPLLLLGDHSGRLIPGRLGNLGVPAAEMERHIAWDIGIDAAARVREIFEPYQAAIGAELDRRVGAPCAFIALHSFTPMLRSDGVARPWPVGVLYDRDPAFAVAVMGLLRGRGYLVGDNEPYRLSDESDYTVVVHAEGRGLPYVELEIRQDLIADEDGQREWAAVLAEVLTSAWEGYGR